MLTSVGIVVHSTAVARPAYSTRIYSAPSLAAVNNAVWTVAGGTVLIVRDVDVVGISGAAGYVLVYAGGTGATFVAVPTLGVREWYGWRGRQALPAGEVLHVLVGGTGTFDVTISGYVLSA